MKVLRIILAMVFMFSGFVKAIDPMGLSYKIQEYLLSFGFISLRDLSINIAVFLCAFELCLGLMLMCNIHKKLIAAITTFTSFIFLLITFLIYMDTYISISNCGCFGEAISMSNNITFFKNIFLFILAFIYMVCIIKEEFKSEKIEMRFNIKEENFLLNSKKFINTNAFNSTVCLILIFVLSCSIPAYSMEYLPPFDFMEYDRGANLALNQNFENKIFDKYDKDISKDVITEDNEILFFVAKDMKYLSELDIKNIEKLNGLLKNTDIKTYILTNSDISENEIFKKICLSADEIFLKSFLRSNKGVVLINNGIIRAKWEMDHFPFSRLMITDDSEILYKGFWGNKKLLNSQDYLKVKYLIILVIILILLYIIKNRGCLYKKWKIFI